MTVHLARKWRSKNFNDIIGQELSVRLLKNSLFKKSFFPAYLFSGLRGSGKTSMGRIFAAAVNCERLNDFIAAPQQVSLACGTCASCKALFAGQHPDFIEIDAASHTGVDNMRALIESASLLPTLSQKKIYLIDEAHMLSKAAFNAALKILEEPPVHVIFILATTDPEKIIETIRSRCFQVFFDPIPLDRLTAHLATICQQENIHADKEGLVLIAEQSGGSARDAITTLERIALAEGEVTQHAVQRALGLLQHDILQRIMDTLIGQDLAAMVTLIHEHALLSYNPLVLWQGVIERLRVQLYEPKNIQDAQRYTLLVQLLRIAYESEQLLVKSSTPAAIIEYMLIRMCRTNSLGTVPSPLVSSDAPREAYRGSAPTTVQSVTVQSVTVQPKAEPANTPLSRFIEEIKPLVDPLVITLFSGATIAYESVSQAALISCLKEHELFKEWIEKSLALWKPVLEKIYGPCAQVQILFTGVKRADQASPAYVAVAQARESQVIKATGVEKRVSEPTYKPSENLAEALKIFPGTVQELK